MKVRARKQFITTRFGTVSEGQKLDVPDGLARQWLQLGMVEEPSYSTKVEEPEAEVKPEPEKPKRSRKKD